MNTLRDKVADKEREDCLDCNAVGYLQMRRVVEGELRYVRFDCPTCNGTGNKP